MALRLVLIMRPLLQVVWIAMTFAPNTANSQSILDYPWGTDCDVIKDRLGDHSSFFDKNDALRYRTEFDGFPANSLLLCEGRGYFRSGRLKGINIWSKVIPEEQILSHCKYLANFNTRRFGPVSSYRVKFTRGLNGIGLNTGIWEWKTAQTEVMLRCPYTRSTGYMWNIYSRGF